MLKPFAILTLLLTGASALQAGDAKLVDLSHTFGPDTLYWPTSPSRFEHKELAFGPTPRGYFYSSYSLCTPEHGGTHLDAPIHFDKDGLTVDRVPLENLMLPAVVLDVRKQALQDRTYRLTVADIQAFEAIHGKIAKGSALLLMTGWDQFWPDAKSYLGADTPGDASNLSFPSFGEEAATFLVNERAVKLIGIDTASIDYGPSKNFPVHQVIGAANIPALENLTGLAALPSTGATIIALPMKIKEGSGGPARVIALVPQDE